MHLRTMLRSLGAEQSRLYAKDARVTVKEAKDAPMGMVEVYFNDLKKNNIIPTTALIQPFVQGWRRQRGKTVDALAVVHGIYQTYANNKCRCDNCRRAWRDYQASHRDKKKGVIRTEFEKRAIAAAKDAAAATELTPRQIRDTANRWLVERGVQARKAYQQLHKVSEEYAKALPVATIDAEFFELKRIDDLPPECILGPFIDGWLGIDGGPYKNPRHGKAYRIGCRCERCLKGVGIK